MFENQNMQNVNNPVSEAKKNFFQMMTLFLLILCVFFIVKIFIDFKGGPDDFGELHTISVSGYGEVQAIPDIATVSFTIMETAETVEEAQNTVTEIEEQVLESLKESGVEERDVKTINSSFNPRYERRTTQVICNEFGCPPSSGKSVIVGYEVRETIQIKIRDTESVGEIIQKLGALRVSSLNGPNFTIDDEDALKLEARRLAIEDAREEAGILARDLGVKLKDVVSFSESGGYYPMATMERAMLGADSGVEESAPSPQLPKGENTISSNVNITYQIK